MYKNSHGAHLYRRCIDGVQIWSTAAVYGIHGFYKSVGTAMCPEDIRQWQYKDPGYDGVVHTGDITVNCS